MLRTCAVLPLTVIHVMETRGVYTGRIKLSIGCQFVRWILVKFNTGNNQVAWYKVLYLDQAVYYLFIVINIIEYNCGNANTNEKDNKNSKWKLNVNAD